MKNTKTLTSWSYSVYVSYISCPMAVFFDKILRIKMPESKSPALIRGDLFHKALAATIQGKEKLPGELKPVAKIVADLVAGVKPKPGKAPSVIVNAEQDWTFTKAWGITKWLAADAWLRIKTDVVRDDSKLVQIVDWKTGKVYDDHAQQRSLYGLGALIRIEEGLIAGGNPKAVVQAQHIYTDTGQTATEQFTMKDLAPLKREWLARIKQMMSDTRFGAKPGNACRWCRYSSDNGGPCKEG